MKRIPTHILKMHPDNFRLVSIGEKTSEIRLDRDFRKDDRVIFCEYDKGEYSGRQITCRISHVFSGCGVEYGYVMLSLNPEP